MTNVVRLLFLFILLAATVRGASVTSTPREEGVKGLVTVEAAVPDGEEPSLPVTTGGEVILDLPSPNNDSDDGSGTQDVPEPGMWLLAGAGLAGVAGLLRRARR
jgi:hypothetical protein